MSHRRNKTHRRKTGSRKMYSMVGCSRKYRGRGNRSCKRGGALGFAYTGKPISVLPNPHLAYTGKGGATPRVVHRFINSHGGSRRKHKKGGVCSLDVRGVYNCSKQKGGVCGLCLAMNGGGDTAKYPDGLTGQPWTPAGNWPGTNNVSGDFNHYALNTYKVDPQTSMGSERTTSNMLPKMNGGKKRTRKHRRGRNGGGQSIFAQDIQNAVRSSDYSAQSAWNAWNGYKAPVNPLPYKDQFYGKYDR